MRRRGVIFIPRFESRISGLITVFMTLVIESLFGQSPLDAPGQKQFTITVRSEIARGCGEVFHAAWDRNSRRGLFERNMRDVIQRNQSAHTDSDGFMLGARLSQLHELDYVLRNLRSMSNPPADVTEDIRNYSSSANTYANEIPSITEEARS